MKSLLSKLIIEGVHAVTTMYNEAGTTVKRTNRDCWAIIMKYEGESAYQNMGRSIVSNINRMVILPRGCSYRWKCTKSGHYACIEFESKAESPEIMSFAVENGEELLSIFKKWSTSV